MNQAALLEKFRNESVATASPARLVTMLYDRMVLDVDRGILAIKAGNRAEANTQLQHAQDIISELQACLDHSVWAGSAQLDALYTWLLSQLMTANVQQDADLAQTCRDILAPLRDAWHAAAAGEGGGVTPQAPAAPAVAAAMSMGRASLSPADDGVPRELGVG